MRNAPALLNAKEEEQKWDLVGGAFETPMDAAPGAASWLDGENLICSRPHITFIYSAAELPPLRKQEMLT